MKDDYQYTTTWGEMALFFALFIAAILLFSCNSEKRIMRGVDRGLTYQREQTIARVRIFAPCVTSGTSFSTDSAAYKESIDSLYNSRAWYESLIRGLETLPPHPIQQDTLCPEMAKELIQANKEIDYQEQYIIDLTDKFNRIKPVIVNRVDTVEDLAKVMEKDLQLLDKQKELIAVKKERDEYKQGEKKWRKWTFISGGSLLALLIAIGFYIYIQIKKP